MDSQVLEVPLVLVSNMYLEKYSRDIRQNNISWEGDEWASLLTQQQSQLIKAIDKKPPNAIQQAMETDGQAYVDLIVHLLNQLTNQDSLKYLCLLTDDILSANETNAIYFESRKEEYFEPFVRLLESENEHLSLQASKILTMLACSSSKDTVVSPLCKYIAQKLGGAPNDVIDIAIQELESLLRIKSFRLQFWNTKDANAIKEKVIRVSIATFRNLIEKAPVQNLAAMLVSKLLPFAENLSSRKFTDSDILEDVKFIKERLQEDFQSLTTFEKYASEVETAKLEWSPPHKSDLFWRENAYKLEEHQYQILRNIARILSTSANPQVLAIAASDIGYYIKYASKKGKNILQEIGAKQRIMELMTHSDQEVRYQALMAVQKYMHQTW
ncbi:ARM repeat-containing protein [Backusella circina FSU 941]|nr:ARM repeat-containing protein [Backusella circina FSU 941]